MTTMTGLQQSTGRNILMSQPFEHLTPLREKPIDAISRAITSKKNYRIHPIQKNTDCFSERCTNIRWFGIEGNNFYNDPHQPPHYTALPGSISELFLRETVLTKLQRIDERLSDVGLQVWVMDAWRPIAVQDYTHDVWMPNFLRTLKEYDSEEQLWADVEMYSAKGSVDGKIDPSSPPPHSTGAAVDLTIRWRDGDLLYMGSIFDDFTKRANTDFYENNLLEHSLSDIEARNNRRLLYWLMVNEGFANNPTEWWHFSWGDQMWAKLTGADYAVYSCTTPVLIIGPSS